MCLEKVPYGVLTPSAAFGGTDLIERLDARGVKFRVVKEGNL